jgi:predicted nucleotidyltransferase
MSSEPAFDVLLNAMKHGAAALRDHDIPFALAGGLAVYARGGPETEHDVDFVIRQADAERALEVLAAAGFRCEKPPEGWLYKVFDERDAMIDLIFAPNNRPDAVDEILERADVLEVYAIRMRVMSVTDVLATKLLALKEHEVDYDSVLEVARACREQIDWEVLRERVGDWPYAKAFFTLVEELGLVRATA